MRTILAILVVSLSIGSCGFHLRGTDRSEIALDAIVIVSSNTYGDFHRVLAREFSQAGVRVVSQSSDAEFTLTVSGERHTRRAVATTNTISVAEYELRLEVGIALTNRSGEEIFPETSLATERIYSFDNSSLVGSSAEESVLLEEMKLDLVTQILRRVDASVRSFEAAGKAGA